MFVSFSSLLLLLFVVGICESKPNFIEGKTLSDGIEANVVDLEVFGEGRCKDTSYWFGWHMLPMWRLFGASGRINFKYHPYGIKTSCVDTENGEISCTCHHGERECLLNQMQACVIDALPKPIDYVDIVGCIQGKQNITDASEKCFNEPSKLRRETMLNCAQSRRGQELFRSHKFAQDEVAPDCHWVPWIMIDGKRVKDAEDDLWQILCDRYLKPRPIECPKKIHYK